MTMQKDKKQVAGKEAFVKVNQAGSATNEQIKEGEIKSTRS